MKGIAVGLAERGYKSVTFDMRGAGRSKGRASLPDLPKSSMLLRFADGLLKIQLLRGFSWWVLRQVYISSLKFSLFFSLIT